MNIKANRETAEAFPLKQGAGAACRGAARAAVSVRLVRRCGSGLPLPPHLPGTAVGVTGASEPEGVRSGTAGAEKGHAPLETRCHPLFFLRVTPKLPRLCPK